MSALVLFGGLHFIIDTEGGLERIAEALQGLQLDALKAPNPASSEHCGPDRGSMEQQLGTFLCS